MKRERLHHEATVHITLRLLPADQAQRVAMAGEINDRLGALALLSERVLRAHLGQGSA